jgi:hypothetical protein
MGLDYEYNLYFPREQMWSVLESIAAMAAPIGKTAIVLPDRRIILPFTMRFKNQTLVFDDSLKRLSFDISLYFTTDKYIERDLKKNSATEIDIKARSDEKSRVAVGYIYLTVIPDSRDKPSVRNYKSDISCFEFQAATTSMSLLFEKSTSIQRTFQKLLENHNGMGGFLNDPDGVYHSPSALWPPHFSVREMFQILTEPEEHSP